MKKLLCATALLVLPGLASAEPVKLSMADIREVYVALTVVGGEHDHILRDSKPEQSVRVPYDLGGVVRSKIVQDKLVLKPLVSAFDEARNGVIQELSHGLGKIEDGSADQGRLNDETNKMLKAEHDLDLALFVKTDFANVSDTNLLVSLAKLIKDGK